MNSRYLATLLGTASILAFGPFGSIEAQTADQASAPATSGLEEVVVTAQRREERAQAVPITLTTFTQAQLDQQEIRTVSDLASSTPGYTTAGKAGKPQFSFIRGVTGVVGYFAQAPVFLFGDAMFFDQSSVQVLKGPQGTLFGLSTNGGAVLFEPKAPSNNFDGFVQAEGGDYGHYQFQGAVNIPIVADKLLVRIGAETNVTNGYIRDIGDNKELDNEDFWIARGSVTFRPTDDFQNTTVVNYYHSQYADSGNAFVPYAINPGNVISQLSLPGIAKPVPITLGNGLPLSALKNPATSVATYLALLKQASAGQNPSLAFYPNIAQLFAQQRALGPYTVLGTNIPGGPFTRLSQLNIVNTSTWDINDTFTLKNIVSYQEINQTSQVDTDLTPLDIVDQAITNAPQGPEVDYSEELQLQGKLFNDKLSVTVGEFNFWSWPQTIGERGAYAAGRAPHSIVYNCTLGTCTGAIGISSDRTVAGYAQGTYDLSDYVSGLSFTAGYRYSWDRAYRTQMNYDATGKFTSSSSDAATFQAPSLHFSLDYQFTPATLFYASYSKGYSSGGFNVGNLPSYLQEYKPEYLKNFEIGVKSDYTLGFIGLPNVKMRSNVTGYYGNYENIKQNVAALVSGALTVLTENAASADVAGVEGQFTIQPIEDLELSANASYNHMTFIKFISPGTGQDLSSSPQTYNPFWQFDFRGTYHLPFDHAFGDISLTAVYDWQGRRSNSIAVPQIPQDSEPAFGNLDMSADWQDVWGKPGVSARLWVNNLLENSLASGSLTTYQSLGIYERTLARPRMYGVTLRYEFGASDDAGSPPAAYVPPPAVVVAPTVPHSYMVFFDFNKSDLTPAASTIVDQAAHNAGPSHVTQLSVTGYTDTVGSDAYNMRLSRRRAESVAAQLEKDGIASSEIEIVAKGKRDLLVPTADGVKEPQNRRVQIVYSASART